MRVLAFDESTELAWSAGFLDGEGNFSFIVRSDDKGRGRLIAQADQTDRDPLDRLCASLGGTVYGPYVYDSRPAHKPYYKWTASNAEAVEAIDALMPYLSGPKLKQAAGAIVAYWRRRPAKKTGPAPKEACVRGHDYADAYIRPDGKGRQCRECNRIRQSEGSRSSAY